MINTISSVVVGLFLMFGVFTLIPVLLRIKRDKPYNKKEANKIVKINGIIVFTILTIFSIMRYGIYDFNFLPAILWSSVARIIIIKNWKRFIYIILAAISLIILFWTVDYNLNVIPISEDSTCKEYIIATVYNELGMNYKEGTIFTIEEKEGYIDVELRLNTAILSYPQDIIKINFDLKEAYSSDEFSKNYYTEINEDGSFEEMANVLNIMHANFESVGCPIKNQVATIMDNYSSKKIIKNN